MNAIKFYRLGNWAYKKNIPLIPRIMELLIRLFFNSVLYSSTEIGKKSFLAYGGIAVVIHKRAKIGERVIISQCVTIGGRSNHSKVPIIGNDVYIGASAQVLGPIKIGNNVTIGAGSVVIKDIPDNAVVAGVPAKIIKMKENTNE
jgi:serine O-acetyltransferase